MVTEKASVPFSVPFSVSLGGGLSGAAIWLLAMPQLLKQVAQGVSFEEALEKEFKTPAERLEKDWKRWLIRFF